jgi:hypothetical protein
VLARRKDKVVASERLAPRLSDRSQTRALYDFRSRCAKYKYYASIYQTGDDHSTSGLAVRTSEVVGASTVTPAGQRPEADPSSRLGGVYGRVVEGQASTPSSGSFERALEKILRVLTERPIYFVRYAGSWAPLACVEVREPHTSLSSWRAAECQVPPFDRPPATRSIVDA